MIVKTHFHSMCVVGRFRRANLWRRRNQWLVLNGLVLCSFLMFKGWKNSEKPSTLPSNISRKRFNRLVNPSVMISSIDEHSKQIQGLLNFIKNIQIACSGIRSSPLMEKQSDIKAYLNQLTQSFPAEQPVALTAEATQHLTGLLYQLLSILISHIHTYANAFLIPYEVEIYNDKNDSIDIQRLDSPVN